MEQGNGRRIGVGNCRFVSARLSDTEVTAAFSACRKGLRRLFAQQFANLFKLVRRKRQNVVEAHNADQASGTIDHDADRPR